MGLKYDKLVAESLTTMGTFCNIYNDMKSRATSVFCWKLKSGESFMKKFGVHSSYVERGVYSNGRIAFAYDKILNKWLVGGFSVVSENRITRIPTRIRMIGRGTYFNQDEFCILYDTQSRVPIFPLLYEKCRRYAETMRTIDVNVHQQRTPRITVVPEEKLLSVKNMYAQADDYRDNIYGVGNEFDMNAFNSILTPAPAVFVQLNEYRHDLYNEMLNIIGVTSVTVDKKDRHTSDEVLYSVGGTYQSRFNREYPRQEFILEMKEKLDVELECLFYDDVTFNREEVKDDDV